MPAVHFTHPKIGTLTIDNGIDDAQWAYGLNTSTIPTYGGEVVQILSVYIDDLTLSGTVSTYRQLQDIYSYFIQFFIQATQGSSKTVKSGEAYDMDYMTWTYPERNWKFFIYPMQAPGFQYTNGMVGPQWQLQAHIIDDSPDLSVIEDGIKGAIVPNSGVGGIKGISGVIGQSVGGQGLFSLNGNISPKYGQPNTDPFQTYDSGVDAEENQIKNDADYYSSLIPSYMNGDFSSIIGTVGSQPAFGKKKASQGTQVKTPKKS